MVFLDRPSRGVAIRLLRGTLARRIHRTQLWHGNREPPLHTVFTDPEHLLRLVRRGHRRARRRLAEVLARPDAPPAARLWSAREVRAWLDLATQRPDR